MKLVALLCILVVWVHSTEALAQLRTVRRGQLSAAVPVPTVPAANEAAGVATTADGAKVEMVMAEIQSEADSITEDGSNDASATEDAEAEADSLHSHFRKFTEPMNLLPNDHTTLVEVSSRGEGDEEGGADKGSNPTYILPVDPFNYFPFFNGFSNVNPFSQFYPPPPYLYPQYTNYMHQYAAHGAGHPPGYPYPGAYGGLGHAYGHAHGGFPYNYPHPAPHMHYPFGAYKMDVSGPDVRTGSNNPPPFPQFAETQAHVKLITPEIIPKAHAHEEEEEGDTVIAALIETGTGEEDESEIEYESEEGSDESEDVEIQDEAEEGSEMASNVEILDESEDANELSSSNVEFQEEESQEATDVEYMS